MGRSRGSVRRAVQPLNWCEFCSRDVLARSNTQKEAAGARIRVSMAVTTSRLAVVSLVTLYGPELTQIRVNRV